MNDSINSILVSGGTHGNELTGVEIVNHWHSLIAEQINIDESLKVDVKLINTAAIELRRRFIDQDLNRQFSPAVLTTLDKSDPRDLCVEQQLAKQLQADCGPKDSPRYDLVVDIHNTTSNMGPSIILLESTDFERQLARFIKSKMPSALILVEDHIAYKEHPYFCTIGKKGLMLELGPQAHGGLRHEILQQARELLTHLFAFMVHWNKDEVPQTKETEAFKLLDVIYYPTKNEQKLALIHPSLEAKDFQVLTHGDPIFITHAGDEITWQGKNVYPHFIGEVAYHHLNIAFATAEKIAFLKGQSLIIPA